MKWIRDPESFLPWIRDPGWKNSDPETEIRYNHPGSATLVVSSDNLFLNPNKLVLSPDKLVLCPHKLVLSPDKLVLSPQKLIFSPDQLVLSTNKLVLSADKLVLSPDKLVLSPNKLIFSPDKLVLSPNKLIFSPDKLVLRPDKLVQVLSPDIGSDTPKGLRPTNHRCFSVWTTQRTLSTNILYRALTLESFGMFKAGESGMFRAWTVLTLLSKKFQGVQGVLGVLLSPDLLTPAGTFFDLSSVPS